ncbi:hypothetical protein ABEF95_004459 [Exophiala dermatitidis]
MAQTRGATGNSKPRIFAAISTEPVTRRKTTTKKRTTAGSGTGTGGTTTTTTTNKRKGPAASNTGRVTKKEKRAPATHHKRKPTVADKIEGAAEKIVGTIENKPGKKAAGTKKMRGTDGKNNKTAAASAVAV